MINFYNQVPSIYPNASRDFQYLSWLINIVLNSVKHNVDDIYNLPNASSDAKLTELLAMTLGFKVKRNYDQKQLIALVAILPKVLKYKGTEKAILMAAEALVKATGSLGEAAVELDGTVIKVTLPKDLIDITLFLDLLDYILPAGMTCRVVRKNKNTKKIKDISIKHTDIAKVLDAEDLSWCKNGEGTVQSTGLANMYIFEDALELSDFTTAGIKELNGIPVPNTGLINNMVIPVLADGKLVEVDETSGTVVLYSTEIDASGQIKYEPLKAGIDEASAVVLRAKDTIQEL